MAHGQRPANPRREPSRCAISSPYIGGVAVFFKEIEALVSGGNDGTAADEIVIVTGITGAESMSIE